MNRKIVLVTFSILVSYSIIAVAASRSRREEPNREACLRCRKDITDGQTLIPTAKEDCEEKCKGVEFGSCEVENYPNGAMTCQSINDEVTECSFTCDEGYLRIPPALDKQECPNKVSWDQYIFPPCCIEPCSPPIDIVFVLDSSSSIPKDKWEIMKKATIEFFRNCNIQSEAVQGGIIRYNGEVDESSSIFLNSFVNDKDGFLKAAEKIPKNGHHTRTGKALQYVRTTMLKPENGGRPDTQKYVFILSDGFANDEVLAKNESALLKEEGVILCTLGINGKHEINSEFLYSLASSSDWIANLEDEDILDTLTEYVPKLLQFNGCSGHVCNGYL